MLSAVCRHTKASKQAKRKKDKAERCLLWHLLLWNQDMIRQVEYHQYSHR